MAPFELLPNEMAEIPIKMAMAKMHRPLQKYEFLANVIAKISTRFMTLALKLMQELTVERPPRMRQEGKRGWMVEYFKDNQDIAIPEVQYNQTVYVFRCERSTVRVSGKCKSIVLDGCEKTAVVFDDVATTCEFVNCRSVQMQVFGKVPTISIDKTEGCQMYLSRASIGTEIVTDKSSAINVLIPNGDDFVEQAIPEQFKTVVDGLKLKTSVVELDAREYA